jgi:hypothetical protein
MFCALVVLYGLADLLNADLPTAIEASWTSSLAKFELPRPNFMTMCHVEMITQIGAEDHTKFRLEAIAGAAWK